METKLTWSDIYKSFKEKYPDMVSKVLDYRPYAYVTIQIWLSDGTKIIYNYDKNELDYIPLDSAKNMGSGNRRKQRKMLLSIFPDNLKRLMMERNFTPTDLSKTSGLSLSTITRYMKGERVPDITRAKLLADALGCTMEDLLNTKE